MEYIGGENGDVLTASSGESNSFSGGGGNDTLTGGTGTDTATYAGTSAGYRLSYAQGQWTVTDVDLADGDTGADTLSGIELLQFGAEVVDLGMDGAFRANTTTSGEQRETRIAALADGGFVVSWTSVDGDPAADGWGVYAQRYAADGAAVGAEFQVNTTTPGYQNYHSSAGLPDGGFILCWTSYPTDGTSWAIHAQRYGADGAAVGSEFPVSVTVAGLNAHPSVTSLANGGFLVSWHAADEGGSTDVVGRRFAADGSAEGGEFRMNTMVAGEQVRPQTAALPDGGFVVCWTSAGQDGSGYGVYAQRYDAMGAPAGGEFRINSTTAGSQHMPSVSALSDGFVVSWVSDAQDGSGASVYAQRFTTEGVAVGGEFRVNTTTADAQYDPIVSDLAGGGFVVSWTSMAQDGSGRGIYAQRYSAEGTTVGGEFRVNVATVGDQLEAEVAGLVDGGFVVDWTSYEGGGDIHVRRYDAAGNPWLQVHGDGQGNTLSLVSDGPVALHGGGGDDAYEIVDTDQHVVERADEGQDTVYASITYALGASLENLVLQGSADLQGTGNALANQLAGNGGANVLDGLAGADTMGGAAGNDIYRVDDAGDKVIESSAAGGTDKVLSTVSFVLGANVEKLTLVGTATANASGNALANVLAGNAAANVLNGKAGADHMSGGAGNDTYYVDNAGDVVSEARATWGQDKVVSSISYTLGSFVERLQLTGANALSGTGNAVANELVGNGVANVLDGAGGRDTLDGGLGKDMLTGGAEADRFVFASVAGSSGRAWDTITDFVRRSDKIDLSQLDANATESGAQHFTFIGATAFGSDATGQLRLAVVNGKLMLHGSTDADVAAEFAVEIVGATGLAAGDLIL